MRGREWVSDMLPQGEPEDVLGQRVCDVLDKACEAKEGLAEEIKPMVLAIMMCRRGMGSRAQFNEAAVALTAALKRAGVEVRMK